MAAKSFTCVVFLAAVALLASVSVGFTTSGPQIVASPAIGHHIPAFDRNQFRSKRRLRPAMDSTVEEDDSYDERALDFSIGKLTEAAKSGTQKLSAATKKLADSAKLRLVSNKQQATDDLFLKFNVGEVETKKLFNSPQFQEWTTSVNTMFKKHPEKAELAIFSSLAAHYGDDVVAGMLAAATKVSSTRDFAKKLQQTQLESWVSNGKSADDVFTFLKLEKEGDLLFESPMMRTWVAYVEKLDNGNTDKIVFSKLKTVFKDDSLARIVAVAKKDYTTRTLAKKLEEAQHQKWLRDGLTADDIFSVLKLDKAGDKLFESPVLSTWMSYVGMVEKKNPDDLALSVLKSKFEGEELTHMLVAAKQNFNSGAFAGMLERAQLTTWKNDGKLADGVFNLLKLNKEGDNILKAPAFSTWYSYVRLLGKNPDDELFAVLKTRYDDEGLTKLLGTAKKDVRTRYVAEKLEDISLKNWLAEGKSTDDVFNLLAVGKERDGLLESPAFSTWVSYVSKFDEKNPDELILKKLNKVYGDKVVVKLLAEANKVGNSNAFVRRLEEETWIRKGMTGNDVFKLLKLDSAGDKVFETPAFSTWVSYVAKLNKLDKTSPSAISQLEKRFGKLELARMLGQTKVQVSLKGTNNNIVNSLQEVQFKKWKTCLDDDDKPGSRHEGHESYSRLLRLLQSRSCEGCLSLDSTTKDPRLHNEQNESDWVK